jgi:hypothetical protein
MKELISKNKPFTYAFGKYGLRKGINPYLLQPSFPKKCFEKKWQG